MSSCLPVGKAVRIAILDLPRQIRPGHLSLGDRPRLDHPVNHFALAVAQARAIGFDGLTGMPWPHLYHDRSRHQRIWQPTEASNGQRSIGRNLFGFDDGSARYTPASHRALAMTSIEDRSGVFILFGLRCSI